MSLALSPVAFERIKAAGHIEPVQETVDLVFASDERYIRFTAVTLASILKSYTGRQAIRVFVLIDKPLPETERAKIDALRSLCDFQLHEIPVDASLFKNIKTSDGISIATYYRLLMHKLLPVDARKVLYLDSDLIIRNSIDELFATPFDGALFAGVEDTISRTYNAKFGLAESAKHPNAGVLLVNVDLMRAIGFSELVERYLESNRYRLVLGDQQIITELFFGSIKYLPVKWNVHGSMFKPDWVDKVAGIENYMDRSEAKAAITDPAIIHYTLKRKPWMSLEHPRAEEWFDYLALTPYAQEITKPERLEAPRPAAKPKQTNKKAAAEKTTLGKFLTVIVPATVVSFTRIRKTRLAVGKLERRLEALEKKTAPAAKAQAAQAANLGVTLKNILVSRSANAPAAFSARAMIEALPANSVIMSNVFKKDMEGGYAENIKTLTKTSHFTFFTDRLPDAVFLLSQRIEQDMFWDCVDTAYLYDLPLYFTEVALFGAFASYFDPDATLNERRALGFMIDDLGYYFDARQPSRIEKTLNSPDFVLTDQEARRARAVINRICAEGITKYNKYVEGAEFEIEPGAVLVIDQKKGDASIQFAGANDYSFHRMLEAAVEENPGRPIYFKRHPDSIQRNMNSYRNRNIGEITVLPDEVTIGSIIDRCDKIYTVSSQVGFEGLMRGKEVVTFGAPFYSGWGLTDDRSPVQRRSQRRTIEELFHVACINQSVYLNPDTGKLIEIEDLIDIILQMRADNAARRIASDAVGG
ncbi:glycosyltransferase [Sinorhizobium fredii]|uniref:glycosyltransferase n=1 Tax=Rhizobium fredii TaxID=380 RepID=UPI0004B5F804|nr:glycosyltransferase [Sinorhizobium fredii]ASY69391.1 Capsular polysaccharide export system protein KpsC [Sinorhizobium fredii CCBAU 83666]